MTAIAERTARQADDVGRFARFFKLSPRETTLLRHALAGMNNDEAAAALGCSRGTVSTFWNRVFRKTNVSGQRDVIILFLNMARGSGTFEVPRAR
jgi:DNA-binding CsgD family transcriptional regulator